MKLENLTKEQLVIIIHDLTSQVMSLTRELQPEIDDIFDRCGQNYDENYILEVAYWSTMAAAKGKH